MDYLTRPEKHYKPAKGWISDPNGCIYFDGYNHVFYQNLPNSERMGKEPFHWGHARTKDFINWEELPTALCPGEEYDRNGCWSGTSVVKDDMLYVCYTSIIRVPVGNPEHIQTISIAYSKDGINFEKYENNPVIKEYPKDGSSDFRDPALICVDGKFYCVIASGHKETKKGRLLLYSSDNMFDWEYKGILAEWDNCEFAECPSLIKHNDKYLLTASVCPYDAPRFFSVMYGDFKDGIFKAELTAEIDKGPDQYAGQMFTDGKGRSVLIAWIPGWPYHGFKEKDIGCHSLPRELFIKDGKLYAYPVEEVRHLLKDSDPAVKITDDGFVIEREGREGVVYKGEINDIKILRDEYIVEVFLNGGEEIYTAIL